MSASARIITNSNHIIQSENVIDGHIIRLKNVIAHGDSPPPASFITGTNHVVDGGRLLMYQPYRAP